MKKSQRLNVSVVIGRKPEGWGGELVGFMWRGQKCGKADQTAPMISEESL